MIACVFAGGNQTRFGKSLLEQPKVLFPLKGGETILSNSLIQLDRCGLEKIIVYHSDKFIIRDYIEEIRNQFQTEVVCSDLRFDSLADYVFFNKEGSATYLFGDIYFPKGELIRYFSSLEQLMSSQMYDAIIGVSGERVGDYGVEVLGGCVQTIIKDELDHRFYTCGVFSIMNSNSLSKVLRTKKLTDIFVQLCESEKKMGFVDLKGLIDLDLFELTNKIPNN